MKSRSDPRLRATTTPAADAAEESAEDECARLAARIEELERARREFVATLSHELRTPLTAMRGSVENLADGLHGALGREQQAAIAIVQRNVERLARVLDRLIGLVSEDQAERMIQPRWSNLSRAVREGARTAADSAKRPGVAVRLELPAAPLSGLVDPERLAELVGRLVEHALRFAAREVSVRLVRVAGEAELCIEDDGIRPDGLERLFPPDGAPETRPGGGLAALELAFVSNIVEAHQGRVWAEPRPESSRGTRRLVRLPLGSRPKGSR